MPVSGRSTPLMRDEGGFDHNAQSLRVVTELERKYARFDGLNLAWETLEGLVKHNGPLIAEAGRQVPQPILSYCAKQDLALDTYRFSRSTACGACRRHCLQQSRRR